MTLKTTGKIYGGAGVTGKKLPKLPAEGIRVSPYFLSNSIVVSSNRNGNNMRHLSPALIKPALTKPLNKNIKKK